MAFVLELRGIGDGISSLSEWVSPEALELEGRLDLEGDLQVEVRIARAGDDLDIRASYTGVRRGACDRCLKPVTSGVSGVVTAIGRRGDFHQELAGQDGVILHDGVRVDLTGEVREAILVDMPIQSLCSEACRGLCASCGTDLNEGTCSCAEEKSDPRWGALRQARHRG